jgi:hypothetical protein
MRGPLPSRSLSGPVGWGQAQGATRASKQTRHVASELSQDARTNAQDIPKGNGWRRDRSQDRQHWESPELGWSSRLCTDKDSQPPRIVAEAQYQKLTGRLAANGKRRETDLQIAPVRVGSWADETSRIGHF